MYIQTINLYLPVLQGYIIHPFTNEVPATHPQILCDFRILDHKQLLGSLQSGERILLQGGSCTDFGVK